MHLDTNSDPMDPSGHHCLQAVLTLAVWQVDRRWNKEADERLRQHWAASQGLAGKL
jgi:hypothetical protein